MAAATPLDPRDVLRALKAHPWRLALPALSCGVLGLVVALVRSPTWEASQAMILRDDASGARASHPGQFSQLDTMKTAQETILELSHSRIVLSRALADVGPPEDYSLDPAQWPTDRDIDDAQEDTKIAPPKGAEFGKTELFYVKAQAKDRQRAVALSAALSRNLQARFEELRNSRANSVIDELVKTVTLAEADLQDSTDTLTQLESSVGQDLAELRMLNESPSGESDLRKMTVDLEAELRAQKAALKSCQLLLNLLQEGQENPGRLLASPSRLLDTQPALKRLKEGLVDAQLATAKLQGMMSLDHPQVRAAREGEREIGQHLHDELEIAIRGAEIDQRIAADRVANLERQEKAVNDRRNRLAQVRADYANLVSMTKHRTEILKTAQLELSEARAMQAATQLASVLDLVDTPDTGSKPLPPGKITITLGSLLGGLMLGAAWLFLSIQPVREAQPAGAAKSSSAGFSAGGAGSLRDPGGRESGARDSGDSEFNVQDAWRRLRSTKLPTR